MNLNDLDKILNRQINETGIDPMVNGGGTQVQISPFFFIFLHNLHACIEPVTVFAIVKKCLTVVKIVVENYHNGNGCQLVQGGGGGELVGIWGRNELHLGRTSKEEKGARHTGCCRTCKGRND